MKKPYLKYLQILLKKSKYLFFSSLIFISITAMACNPGKSNSTVKTPKVTIINEDANLEPAIIEGFKNIIYNVYPKLVNDFNENARMDITVKIDTVYEGVAYAHNGRVTVSSKWLHKKPSDLDLMTHEIMHIVQAYPNGSGPGWLTEGIADFVRFKYGINNSKAGWSLPEFSSTQNYSNSYRITARFLVWIGQNYDEKIVYKLDKRLRSNTYSPEIWKEYTGYGINQLWDKYSQNPILE